MSKFEEEYETMIGSHFFGIHFRKNYFKCLQNKSLLKNKKKISESEENYYFLIFLNFAKQIIIDIFFKKRIGKKYSIEKMIIYSWK